MRKRKWYDGQTIINGIHLGITTSDDNVLISDADAREVFNETFFDCVVLLPYNDSLTKDANITSAKQKMQTSFNSFVSVRQRSIDMIYKTLTEDYDPLLNYDRNTTGAIITEHHKGTRTAERQDVVTTPNLSTTTTNTPNTTTTTTNTPNTTTTTTTTPNTTTTTTTTPNTTTTTSKSVYGFDSSTATPTDEETTTATGTTTNQTSATGSDETETTTTGTDETETTITGTDTTTSATTGTTKTEKDASKNYVDVMDISATVFDKDKQIFEEYREFGNIGVNTNADIIQKELALRMKNSAREIILEFLNNYCASWTYSDCMEIIE